MTQRYDEDLTRVLTQFAKTLTGRFEVGEVLYRLAEHVVEMLDATGTGVSLVDPQRGILRPVSGINELTVGLEGAEERFQEGPCVDAFRQHKVVRVDDLDTVADSWPRWSAEARKRGVTSVLGIPLRVRDQALGAMNVYNGPARAWTDADVRVAQVLCDMAASYVANASDLEESRRTTEQLQEALDSRIVIEQAKGIVANELGCSVDDAFHILRSHARANNAALRSVAHAVVHLGLRPPRR